LALKATGPTQIELDPRDKVISWSAGRSVMLDGANHDDENETEDRYGLEDGDRLGGAKRVES